MIESEIFADLLSVRMNGERNFRNSCQDLIKSISKDVFLSCFLTSAFSIRESFCHKSLFLFEMKQFARADDLVCFLLSNNVLVF